MINERTVGRVEDFYYNLPALRKRVKELEEEENKLNYIKSKMRIGTTIYDIEQQKIGIVTKLKNGCNDFEVDYFDGTVGRGFFFLVDNWKFA